MREREIKNAVISSASVCLERDTFISLSICFDYGGSGQCNSINFGVADKNKIVEPNYMAHYIGRILKLVGVNSIKELKGEAIRVDASYGKVFRIGHYLEDKWYDISEIAKGEA